MKWRPEGLSGEKWFDFSYSLREEKVGLTDVCERGKSKKSFAKMGNTEGRVDEVWGRS